MKYTLPERRCGTCKFLAIPPNAKGNRIPQPNSSYKCDYKVPEIPLPDSVRNRLAMSACQGTHDLPRWGMSHDDGHDCPVWEKYVK